MTKETFGILFVVLCVIFVLNSCSADDPAPIKSIMAEEDVKEEPKPEPKQVPKEEEFVPYQEKVCIEINGKEKCRTITKHQKHEGTKIKK
jgi:Tfp pilus assembly protein PilP